MCGGARYRYGREDIRTFFPAPTAVLPVVQRDGSIRLVTWGRRSKDELGELPITGWARLDSVTAGKWQRYHPIPVKIAVDEFMEKDAKKDSHWYRLKPAEYIRGSYASMGDEHRVYVVTVPAPAGLAYVHDRWPRMVTNDTPPRGRLAAA
jgi:hypothetical protein